MHNVLVASTSEACTVRETIKESLGDWYASPCESKHLDAILEVLVK